MIGKVKSFKYDIKVVSSHIGHISFNLIQSPFVKRIVRSVIMRGADKILHKGIPLPGSYCFIFNHLEVGVHDGYVDIAASVSPSQSMISNQNGTSNGDDNTHTLFSKDFEGYLSETEHIMRDRFDDGVGKNNNIDYLSIEKVLENKDVI